MSGNACLSGGFEGVCGHWRCWTGFLLPSAVLEGRSGSPDMPDAAA